MRYLLLPLSPFRPVRISGLEEAGDAGGADDEGASADDTEEDDQAVAELSHGCFLPLGSFFGLLWGARGGVDGKAGRKRGRRSGLVRSEVCQSRGGDLVVVKNWRVIVFGRLVVEFRYGESHRGVDSAVGNGSQLFGMRGEKREDKKRE